MFVRRSFGRPASVSSPLISTIWCFRAYKPYIFCEDMILATCQCQILSYIPSIWVLHSLLLFCLVSVNFLVAFLFYIQWRVQTMIISTHVLRLPIEWERKCEGINIYGKLVCYFPCHVTTGKAAINRNCLSIFEISIEWKYLKGRVTLTDLDEFSESYIANFLNWLRSLQKLLEPYIFEKLWVLPSSKSTLFWFLSIQLLKSIIWGIPYWP